MSSKNKELTLQETFYNICKDLMRYIDRKIVKKYVSPNQAQIPKDKKINENIHKDNKWRYFFEDEDTTEEERIKDIFKDNKFLFRLQKLNNELNSVIINMDENKIKKEKLHEMLNQENEKMKLSSEMNNQLINYFMEKNMNLNLINQNDITKAIEDLKKYSLINTTNQNIFQPQSKDKINKEAKEINNNLKNTENIDNVKEIKEINIKDNDKINNNNKENEQSNDTKSIQNKIITNLIQAFDILNKNKKKKIKEGKINKLMENIFGEDSSDNDEENEELEEEEGEEEEENEGKKNNKTKKNKNKNNISEKKKESKMLNRKIKRNKK